VHLEPPANVRLGSMRKIVDQPENRDHLLGQAQLREGLGEMPVGRAMGEADMEADDLVDRPDAALNGRLAPTAPRSFLLAFGICRTDGTLQCSVQTRFPPKDPRATPI